MARRSPLEGLLLLVTVWTTLVTASSRSRRQGGEAGVDYPTYSEVPPGLSFTCSDKIPGYYADPEAQCQVWHWCVPGGVKYSFLCPNQTLFNQVYRVCDWWFNVDCVDSPKSYINNEELYQVIKDTPKNKDLLQKREDDTVVEESQLVEEEVMMVTEQPQEQLQEEQQMQDQQEEASDIKV